MAMNPPCHRTRNRAFIDPSNAADYSIRAAIRICEACPIRRRCALDALHAGDSLDGQATSPARAVIAAGVVCEGDKATGVALAGIAGVSPPVYRVATKRSRVPERCKHCRRLMVSWTRGAVPEGYVMHRGRGYCTESACRRAYSLELREVDKSLKLTKDIDRKHAYVPTRAVDIRRRFIARYVGYKMPGELADNLHSWVTDKRANYRAYIAA